MWADADVKSAGAPLCSSALTQKSWLPVIDWIQSEAGKRVTVSTLFSPVWSHRSKLEVCDCWNPEAKKKRDSEKGWDAQDGAMTAPHTRSVCVIQRSGSWAEACFLTALDAASLHSRKHWLEVNSHSCLTKLKSIQQTSEQATEWQTKTACFLLITCTRTHPQELD